MSSTMIDYSRQLRLDEGKNNDCDKIKLDWQFMMKNQNNNDFKLGRTIKCKTREINKEKKLKGLGFSRKQSLW